MGKICKKCGTHVLQPVRKDCFYCGGPLVDDYVSKGETDKVFGNSPFITQQTKCTNCGNLTEQTKVVEEHPWYPLSCKVCGGKLVAINETDKASVLLVQKQKQEMFEYKININNCIKRFQINFINDEFNNVTFDFKNPYSREEWKALAEIEETICEIEKELEAGR